MRDVRQQLKDLRRDKAEALRDAPPFAKQARRPSGALVLSRAPTVPLADSSVKDSRCRTFSRPPPPLPPPRADNQVLARGFGFAICLGPDSSRPALKSWAAC